MIPIPRAGIKALQQKKSGQYNICGNGRLRLISIFFAGEDMIWGHYGPPSNGSRVTLHKCTYDAISMYNRIRMCWIREVEPELEKIQSRKNLHPHFSYSSIAFLVTNVAFVMQICDYVLSKTGVKLFIKTYLGI